MNLKVSYLLKKLPTALVAATAAVLLAPAAGHAHGVETSLTALDASGLLQFRSQFSSGEPLAGAAVRLQSPDGQQTLDLGRTNADGRFNGRIPAQASHQWELVVDGGPGHRDYLDLQGGPQASHQHSWYHWLAGLGLISGTLALTGRFQHGQRQRRP
jgi:hypothetical protein